MTPKLRADLGDEFIELPEIAFRDDKVVYVYQYVDDKREPS